MEELELVHPDFHHFVVMQNVYFDSVNMSVVTTRITSVAVA
jgi:hypothetical protein